MLGPLALLSTRYRPAGMWKGILLVSGVLALLTFLCAGFFLASTLLAGP